MDELTALLTRISEDYEDIDSPVSIELWHNRGKGFLGAIKSGRDTRLMDLWDYAETPEAVVQQLAAKYDWLKAGVR